MKKYLIISILILFETGCGFHLRGENLTRERFSRTVMVEFNTPQPMLFSVLEKALEQRNITLIPHSEYRIHLTSINNEKRPVVLTSQQKDSVKEVILSDGFTVEIYQQDKLLGERDISSQMVIRYRSSAYLGNSLEEEKAHQQLANENVEKLIRFFQAVARP